MQKRHLRWLLLSSLVAAPLSAQQRDAHAVLTVGNTQASRGQVAYGAIQVQAGADSGFAIPVAVINGARPGRVVAFVAGSHGTEYASIVALTRLIERIDPRTLSGTVIVAPLLNVASFEQMTVHLNPIDRKGMNSQYPGKATGTQSERALALVATNIVDPADVIVDLHGGDIDENLRPYSYWIRTGNAVQDEASRALASAFGLDHIIVRDVDAANPASARSLSGYALARGKIALVAEAGHSGIVVPGEVDPLIEGSLNVLGTLGMIDRPVQPVSHPVWVSGGSRVAADRPGMFYATVDRGAFVNQGTRIGYTTDYLGRMTGNVLSPTSGVVTFIRGVPSTWANATLANISPVLSDPPPAYQKPTT
jgi:predicted deacylase